MELDTEEEKTMMLKEKERADKAIGDIVSKISLNLNLLMNFGFELRKADQEFKYSFEILQKGSP